jgi:uncharacterized protein (TIGR03437 family)
MMTGRLIALGLLCLPLANPQAPRGPALSAGALQVNVQIPASITPRNHVPLQIQIGTASSPPNVTIAVN